MLTGTDAAVNEIRLVNTIFLLSDLLLEKETPNSVIVFNIDINTKMLKNHINNSG